MATKPKTQVKKTTKKVAKVSAYKENVLNTNRALKTETKSLSGAIKTLWFFRKEIGMNAQYTKIVRTLMQDDTIYKSFKADCKPSKAGNYSPFKVLQTIHRSTKK